MANITLKCPTSRQMKTVTVDQDVFERVKQRSMRIDDSGYVRVTFHNSQGRPYEWRLHRMVMGFEVGSGKYDGLIIDHRNQNKLDNRRENLRVVTRSENARNRCSNRIVRAWGQEKTLQDWSEDRRANASYETIRSRLRHGWVPERAISKRVQGRSNLSCILRPNKPRNDCPAIAATGII